MIGVASASLLHSSLDSRLRRALPALAAALGAVGAALLLLATGTVDGIAAVLTEIGFDPDRARFLAALSAAALAAAAGGLVTGRRAVPAIVGLGLTVAAFAPTFVVETQAALTSPPDQGAFDGVGWTLTALTEVTAALAVGWAGAVIAGELRSSAIAMVGIVRSAGRARSRRLELLRPAAFVAGLLVLAIAIPVIGDVTNFGMDALMRQGTPTGVALVGGEGPGAGGTAAGGTGTVGTGAGAAGAEGRGASGTGAAALSSPGGGSASAEGGAAVPASAPGRPGSTFLGSSARPWLGSVPSGTGQVTTIGFPAPWIGGRSSTAFVDVYTPPGYGSGSRHYPVVYEAPWRFSYWDSSVHIGTLLDTMIARGEIPPEIVVFIAHNGGPYPDSECVDSVDGREWFDRYVAQTVVPYVDVHFRTIPTAAGRTVFGFSIGGFCAPVLALHHPDLFGQAVAFSGYYVAGIRSGQTVNAALPFGGDAAAIDANSPISMASTLPPAVRHGLLFVLSGTPGEWFYGQQYLAFATELQRDGYPLALLPSPLAHSWAAVRAALPQALLLVADHQAAAGLFAS